MSELREGVRHDVTHPCAMAVDDGAGRMLGVAVLGGGVDELAPAEALALHTRLGAVRDLAQQGSRPAGHLPADARQLLTGQARLPFPEGDHEIVLRREV